VAHFPQPPGWVQAKLREGQVIPAHPLALTAARKLDEVQQRALTRYYHAAGAGGIAVGVHTTQFAIRDAKYRLLEPVLRLTVETLAGRDTETQRKTVRIAGICGSTKQAVTEAELARNLGYHAGLLSLGALKAAPEDKLIAHCEIVAQELPLVGFYLQAAAGGRLLSLNFWRRFVEVPNVVAVKIAPFNRYQTLDVVRALAETGRAQDIALYTGNDDNIVVDLLTEYAFLSARGEVRLRIVGGLLGHWAIWTRRAVELLENCKRARAKRKIHGSLLTLGAQITDCNAAIFDAANGFAGCVPGIHEVLRRQGLLKGVWCLDPKEELSREQLEEINRVSAVYPFLNDNDFVREHLPEWLAG